MKRKSYLLASFFIVTVLLNACGIVEDTISIQSERKLTEAIRKGDPNAYQLVNQRNANAVFRHSRANPTYTVLHAAAAVNDKKMVAALIANGADINAKYVTPGYTQKPDGYTPAQWASVRKHRELAYFIAGYSGEDISRFAREEEARTLASNEKAKKDWKKIGQAIGRYLESRPSSPRGATKCPQCNGNGEIGLSYGIVKCPRLSLIHISEPTRPY